MTRLVCPIPDGAVLVDCVTRVTSRAMADRIRADIMARDGATDVGIIQYVGKMSTNDPGLRPEHVDAILASGCGFFGVCYADQFDGAYRAELYKGAVGAVHLGLTLASDLESYRKPAATCELALNACARDIEAADLLACLYVGSGQPLTAEQLGRLAYTRYWRSASNVQTPTLQGKLLGWSLRQHLGDPTDPSVDWRHVYRGGVNVDIDTAQPDELGRRLTWLVDAREAPTVPDLSALEAG